MPGKAKIKPTIQDTFLDTFRQPDFYKTFYSGTVYPGVYQNGFKFTHPRLGECEVKASFIGRLHNDMESLYYVVSFSNENFLVTNNPDNEETAYVSRLIISPFEIEVGLNSRSQKV